MSDFDKHAYERAQGVQLRGVQDTLRTNDQFAEKLDSFGNGPVVAFTCPRGHVLRRVRVERVEDGFQLRVIGDQSRAGRAVTSNATPWTGRGVCLEPGCPVVVNQQGWCNDHGGRDIEEIRRTGKTEFTCRHKGCGWKDALTEARLIKLCAMAVLLGHREIPLAGSGAPNR